MILTVTLNPAIDKNIELDQLTVGNVNRALCVKQIAGGKGINVSKVIHQLGGETVAMGLIGGNNGYFIKSVLQDSISCSFVEISGNTRCNTNVISKMGNVTEILEPGPLITEQEIQSFYQLYEENVMNASCVVLSGSVPPGFAINVYQELVNIAKGKGKLVFLDASSPYLEAGLQASPFLIKPNRKELEVFCKRELLDLSEITTEAKRFVEQGMKHVVVSLGEEGFLYRNENVSYFVRPPKITAINTVGCGDSLIAAFAYCFEQNTVLEKEVLEDALRFVTAVSCANALTMENGNIAIEKLKDLEKEVILEKL